jgi:hypothetical protein
MSTPILSGPLKLAAESHFIWNRLSGVQSTHVVVSSDLWRFWDSSQAVDVLLPSPSDGSVAIENRRVTMVVLSLSADLMPNTSHVESEVVEFEVWRGTDMEQKERGKLVVSRKAKNEKGKPIMWFLVYAERLDIVENRVIDEKRKLLKRAVPESRLVPIDGRGDGQDSHAMKSGKVEVEEPVPDM